MDCEVHWIACQLSEIAQKIGQPTAWGITSVALSAVAAFGTLWIAWLNLSLLRRQETSADIERAKAAKARRIEFAHALDSQILEDLKTMLSGGLISDQDTFEKDQRLNRLGRLTLEANEKDLRSYVASMTWGATVPAGASTIGRQLHQELMQVVDEWVDSPASFTLTKAQAAEKIKKTAKDISEAWANNPSPGTGYGSRTSL